MMGGEVAERRVQNRIQVSYRKISELRPDPNNARVHSRSQVRRIVRSIKTFGFNVPVLIDASGKIIAGHGRVLACIQLGWEEVPTICLEHLTPEQVRAFMIADNRLAEISEWDDVVLAQQFKTLADLDLDFELEDTGFDLGEIDLRIEGLSSPDEDARADQIPESGSGPTVTHPGDLWLLNDHRVLCGNALLGDDYATLMENEKAHVVFTDPPYNVRIDGNVSGFGAIKHREFAMASGEMTETEFRDFLTTACRLLVRNSAPEALHYICMDWRHLNELLDAGHQVYAGLKNLCVWVKDNGGLGSFYRSQHELALVFELSKQRHRNNIRLGRFGRNRTNVWHYPCANSFSRSGDEGRLLAVHPTVKPVALVADAIMDCTDRKGIVLDAFLGSGSALIAAERTGRRCYGLELDPSYTDTIVKRWQVFTRGTAIHAATGRSFEELEHERQG